MADTHIGRIWSLSDDLVQPAALQDQLFLPVLITFGLIAPIGGLWGIYQSIRYENSPLKYVAIVVLIPFGFLWYYFERYKRRVSTRIANTNGSAKA